MQDGAKLPQIITMDAVAAKWTKGRGSILIVINTVAKQKKKRPSGIVGTQHRPKESPESFADGGHSPCARPYVATPGSRTQGLPRWSNRASGSSNH